ncbi:hypothetical protein [Protaetiibacter larvae]|uniref:Uncharacterized protein n=1 Tax=Protaetiibacter larvae TaxID=2592654 RepID=A0A5C1Y944_9MICO|nr:hypothetical protein [Protaetiibacter larvae]QEO10286.1 hypothetical protein FLP23_09865 [Protaetiibacter larvae]
MNELLGAIAGAVLVGFGIYLITDRRRVAVFFARRSKGTPAPPEMFSPGLIGLAGAAAILMGFTFVILFVTAAAR